MCKKEQDYFRRVGSQKLCLLFGQYIVDGISNNVTSHYINTSFHMSGFASAARFCVLLLFVKHH